jgi:transposase InsO family protein
LVEQQEQVSRKRVIRLMQEDNLVARARKRYKVTTMSDHDQPVAANRGQRRWNEGKQVFERVAAGAKYDNAQAPLRDVLLKLKVLVAGQETARTERPRLESTTRHS